MRTTFTALALSFYESAIAGHGAFPAFHAFFFCGTNRGWGVGEVRYFTLYLSFLGVVAWCSSGSHAIFLCENICYCYLMRIPRRLFLIFAFTAGLFSFGPIGGRCKRTRDRRAQWCALIGSDGVIEYGK